MKSFLSKLYTLHIDNKQPYIAVFIFTVLSLSTLYPVIEITGWPQNHEFDTFFTRTLIYANHMIQGDFFPIWSSIDNSGYGSAQPALYHKLFYLLSGVLYLLIGSMKSAIILTICFWLIIGASGMFKLCREMGINNTIAICAGAMLIVANYTITDWLVRGAMGELSAYMIIPWAVSYFLQSLKKNHISKGLAVSLALTFLGHSVISYYLVIIFSLSSLILLSIKKLSIKILYFKSIAPALLIFTAIIGPYLYAMFILGEDYDMMRIVSHEYYLPENHVVSSLQHFWQRYFWDTRWTFGQTWESFTIQLDVTINILIIIGTIAGVWHYFNKTTKFSIKQLDVSSLTLTIMLFIAIFLQSKYSIPFYHHIPGAVYLQFPWRLLALLTPTLIALALYLIYRNFSRTNALIITLLATSVMYTSTGAFKPLQYGILGETSLNPKNVKFSAFGEYVPKQFRGVLPVATEELQNKMKQEGCMVNEKTSQVESLKRQFHINCHNSMTLSLPLFSSPWHTIQISDQEKQRCIERTDLAGLCSIKIAKGTSVVDVYLPTFLSIFNNYQ